ncbi:uncharacterized protein C2845_PM07G14640 [Panicum miliaceum]|uniref:RBR-type E3 ubiquitin transferase n=1 Tax=Panicum miliaceum TaxID=4540 RepID=A0A3L6SH74_PANMI|nr:uncharacterized protein C2845_PM07G14640 [Panicum miliaceum]
MALMEGLDAALGLGIRSVTIVTGYRPLYNHMVGIWRPSGRNLADMINQNCTICMEDTDITKIHVVEGCAHRFCFSCMKEHVKVKLLNGMLPACPQDGCTTKLTVEGSKIFLSPRLLGIMVQRVREGQIPPNQKVPWHDRMTCYDYKRRYPHARPEVAKLQNLARQRLWRQCVKCKHMIELAEGCYHMICVCGFEFCYTCGKEWKEKKATCSCPLWDEHNIIREVDEDDDDYEEDEDDVYF